MRARKLNAAAPDPTVDDVGLATQQEAVNTDDAARGHYQGAGHHLVPLGDDAGAAGRRHRHAVQPAARGQRRPDPVVLEQASGLLPPGLTLNASGLISGTPNTAGTYPFVVQVRDSSAPQQIATRALSITITQAGIASLGFVTQPSPWCSDSRSIRRCRYAPSMRTARSPSGFTITIAIGSNPAGGTLSGTLSAVTGASGIAVFPTLSINKTGNYTLVASAAGFPAATSVSFPVTATVASGVAVFNNQIAFLSATGAANATGPLPSLGLVTRRRDGRHGQLQPGAGGKHPEHRWRVRLVSRPGRERNRAGL